jgi:hypothetical protein
LKQNTSLRKQVIRLRERVQELETALAKEQRKRRR